MHALLVVPLAVYAYRDLWPLATFTLTPADLASGNLLWFKIALLVYAGVIISISMPRTYVPYNALVSPLDAIPSTER